MPSRGEIISILEQTKSYLRNSLLPFWIERLPDPEYGGFLSYFDHHERPVDDALGHAWKINYHTVRSLVQSIRQLRMLVAEE